VRGSCSTRGRISEVIATLDRLLLLLLLLLRQ